ncbi:hypothetical protein ACX80V_18270 [Arthrobacter sp. MDT3-24]
MDRLTDPLDEDWVRDSLSWFTLLHEAPQWFVEEAGTINAPTLILWAQDGLLSRSDQEP